MIERYKNTEIFMNKVIDKQKNQTNEFLYIKNIILGIKRDFDSNGKLF